MAQYDLSSEELRQIQQIQLNMLIQVDDICRRHDIHYNIIAGTLLGAIRHKGYIPWDDDADVALFRKDYERFRTVCKEELDKSQYYFQDHTNTKGYRWGYGKFRKKGTLFLRKNQEDMPYEQGIFIDIFPLDKVPANLILRSFHNFHCFCIRNILWSSVGKKQEKNLFKKMCYSILSYIPEDIFLHHYDSFTKKSNYLKSDWVRILTYPTPTKDYGYRKRWYEESIEIEFEGKMFYGIKDWDEYLTFKFGNYWILPEQEKRKTHPITKLKL